MSECGVCIGSDCDGMIEMFESNVVKSRKQHTCLECRREIHKGAQYERSSGLWEGKFETYHVCLDCANIRDGFNCEGSSKTFGELWQQMHDYGFPAMTTGCLAQVETASAKMYLMERWHKWKFKERP